VTEGRIDLRETKVLHRMPTGSETAIVAFSANGSRPDRFHFFPLGKLVPGASTLLVRDPSDNWYNAGLPGVGQTVEEIAGRIEAELAKMGAKRVVTVGSSMGGYAAILFGCLIGAERVVALVPQTLLDPGLPHWRPAAGVELQAPDLRPFIHDAPQTTINAVFGMDDLMDIFHVRRIASAPSVRTLGLPATNHAFPKGLHQKDEYWPFVTTLIEGRVPSMCELEPKFPSGIEEQIGDLAFAWGRGERVAATNALVDMARRHPRWVPPHHALAKGLAQIPAWGEREAVLIRDVEANPGWASPCAELTSTLTEQGRIVEAEALRAVANGAPSPP
jgi:pimeloyl-ACP methyl ester carboxylesterase